MCGEFNTELRRELTPTKASPLSYSVINDFFCHNCTITTSFSIERFHMTSRQPFLVFQNNETAAMLVYQTNPLGVELFSYANTSFCFSKFACALAT